MKANWSVKIQINAQIHYVTINARSVKIISDTAVTVDDNTVDFHHFIISVNSL